MYGHFVVYFTAIICLQLSQSADILDSSDGIACHPLQQVVAVNSSGPPYFVMLQRCQGSFEGHHPERKRCTFNESEDVRVKITSGGHTDKAEYVTLRNHTTCKGECVNQCSPNLFLQDKKSCRCTCLHTTAPRGFECGNDQSWDSQECHCKCNLDKNNPPDDKKLDEKQCKFVCKPRDCPGRLEFNSNTCRCAPVGFSYVGNEAEPDNTQQGKVLAAVVIGEFVFLYLIFDFLLYSKKTGLMYYVRFNVLCKSRGNRNDESHETPADSKRFLENGDEGNNRPLQGVVVDRNGHTRIAQPASST